MKTPLCTFFFLLLSFSLLKAEKNNLPRFVSLRSSEANVRVGPGPNYPVEWVYVKAGLPIEVVAEFDTWRKIRDSEGTEGWIHQNMLTSKRHGLIRGKEAVLYSKNDSKSQPLARLQEGVMVDFLKCQGDWCQVRTNGFKGWIQRVFLWGLYPGENLG